MFVPMITLSFLYNPQSIHNAIPLHNIIKYHQKKSFMDFVFNILIICGMQHSIVSNPAIEPMTVSIMPVPLLPVHTFVFHLAYVAISVFHKLYILHTACLGGHLSSLSYNFLLGWFFQNQKVHRSWHRFYKSSIWVLTGPFLVWN